MTKEEQEIYLNSGFTLDQINEIQEGLELGLDTSIYAKKEFFAIQMRQIRLGMMDKLPVEVYASTAYDWFQMEEIRCGLQDGVDIMVYANPSISYDRMRQIRLGLQNGINLSKYKKLEAGVLRELRKALLSKIYIVEYIQQGYNAEQLEQIRIALEKHLNIVPYLQKEFRGVSIREIREGLEKGLDVSCYAKLDFSWQQMREIRLGMENRVDVSYYANSLYEWQQMQEIRLGLENGIDITAYYTLMYTATDMRRMRLALQQNNTPYIFDGEQSHFESFEGISVTISSDEMEALVYVEDSDKLTKAQVMKALELSGVKRGIMESDIDKLLRGKFKSKTMKVAKGKPATEGSDGWYEFFFKTELDRQPKLMPDGSVDFSEIQWYELVQAGQRIALYHDAEMGTAGFTVTGRALPARRGREQSVLTGKGFTLLEDNRTYTASVSGRIELDGNCIDIDKTLTIEEVSLATGNITFDGSVYVSGNVGVGAVIQATGDVVVNGYVESATIESSEGSIFIKQGVNGNAVGYIKAAVDVSGKFFESCRVYAGNEIRAGYCLNCDLYSENRIVVSGKNGQVAGGTAYAKISMDMTCAGNRVGIATKIRLGVNDEISGQKDDVEERIAETNKQLDILRNAYADFHEKYPPEVRNTMDMYLKVESAIFAKEKEMDMLMQYKMDMENEMKAVKNAHAVIHDTLYEGTVFEINGKHWAATQSRNVKVRRAEGRVVVQRN
ncbi:MAG: DUF342 domain-containing protein [Acetatifactor sp.]|nr:DUF342 domain-containing protein [Acetatifactor sp.]